MNRVSYWLETHRLINIGLLLLYVISIVFAHDFFVQVSVDVMNSLSLNVYNRLVASIVTMALLGLLFLVFYGIKKREEINSGGLVFLLATIIGLVVHFFVFTEMNIEFIHAMEFGFLAVLIYPLVGRFGAAVVYAFPIMLLDEWFQYQMLFDYVEYFDFNDVLLDLLGAGLFLSILKTFNGKMEEPKGVFHRPEVYILTFVGVAILMLITASVIVLYATDVESNTLLILNDIREPYGFWREHPLIGSEYHVQEPVEGLITVFTVCAIYLLMDPIRSEK
jgi:hypothetical protein